MRIAFTWRSASQSLEEAFLTEIRVRLAERKAREFISAKLAQVQSSLEEKAGK